MNACFPTPLAGSVDGPEYFQVEGDEEEPGLHDQPRGRDRVRPRSRCESQSNARSLANNTVEELEIVYVRFNTTPLNTPLLNVRRCTGRPGL
jgi:hypothetical protein